MLDSKDFSQKFGELSRRRREDGNNLEGQRVVNNAHTS
jgi:hypothetical protein